MDGSPAWRVLISHKTADGAARLGTLWRGLATAEVVRNIGGAQLFGGPGRGSAPEPETCFTEVIV